MMKTVLTFLLVLLLFPAAATAQEYNIPDTVPLTINLREEPRGFEGPLYQYALVLDNSWTVDSVYRQLEPFIAPDIRSKKQVELTREHLHYQHPGFPLRGGNARNHAELVHQIDIPRREALENQALFALEALGWGEDLWVQALMTMDERLAATTAYQPHLVEGNRKVIAWLFPQGTQYVATAGRSLGGYPLAIYMENEKDDYFVSNLAEFALDGDGNILAATMGKPWRVVATSPIEQPLMPWQGCIPLLVENGKRYWGEHGIREHNYPTSITQFTKSRYELIAIEPIYVVRNLDNGRFVAMPAWECTVKVNQYTMFNENGRQQFQRDDLHTVRFFTYVFNALTGESS